MRLMGTVLKVLRGLYAPHCTHLRVLRGLYAPHCTHTGRHVGCSTHIGRHAGCSTHREVYPGGIYTQGGIPGWFIPGYSLSGPSGWCIYPGNSLSGPSLGGIYPGNSLSGLLWVVYTRLIASQNPIYSLPGVYSLSGPCICLPNHRL